MIDPVNGLRKHSKKAVVFLSAALLALPLAACGGAQDDPTGTPSDTGSAEVTSDAETTPEETTAEETTSEEATPTPDTTPTEGNEQMDLAWEKINLNKKVTAAKVLVETVTDKVTDDSLETLKGQIESGEALLASEGDIDAYRSLSAGIDAITEDVQKAYKEFALPKLQEAITNGEKALADFPDGDAAARTRLENLLEAAKRAVTNDKLNGEFLDTRADDIQKEADIVAGIAPAETDEDEA